MSFARLSSLILWSSLLSSLILSSTVGTAAYKVDGHHRTSQLYLHGNRRPYIHESHLRDEPLILTHGPENDDLVVSERPTHGLNKLIGDRNRRNAANEPKFKVGTTVYVRNGTLRSSKGTVLYNKPEGIGESYKVQVALDCRDKRGYLGGPRSAYHGISTWFLEDELTDQIPYNRRESSPSQELLPTKEGFRYDSGLSYMHHRELIDSYDPKDITDIYNTIVSKGLSQKYTCFTTLVQLAKVYSWKQNHMAFDESQQRELLENIYQVVLSNDTFDQQHLSWMIWSLGIFDTWYNLKKITRHLDIFQEVEKKLSFHVLKYYDQKALQGIAWAYSRLANIGVSLLKNLAKVIKGIPVEELEVSNIATIAFSMYRKKMYDKKFLDHVSNLIVTRPHDISAYCASKLLPLFSLEALERSNIVELLGSIVFANEGDRGRKCHIHDNMVANLVRGFIRNRECFRMLTDYLCYENPKLSSDSIVDAIIVLQKAGVSCKLGEWFVKAAMEDITSLDSFKLLVVISHASQVWNVPDGFAPLLRDYITSPFAKPEVITPSVFLAAIGFFLKHKNRDETALLDILARLNQVTGRGRIVTIAQGYSIISALYNIGESAEHNYPNLIYTCLLTLRSCLGTVPVEFFGLYLCMLSSAAPDLLVESSMLAARWMEDPGISTDTYDKHTISLAEMLISAKIAFENVDFTEEPRLEAVSLSRRPTLGKILMFGKEALWQFNEAKKQKWPLLFLDLMVRSNLINSLTREQELLQYSLDNAATISNKDLTRLVDSLKALGLYDDKWESFVRSVPRGISRISN